MPTYYTHDNGDRPFKVVIKDDVVTVYKELEYDSESKTAPYSEKPVLHIKPMRIFVGRSPLTRITKMSGGAGQHGNTMLFQIAPLTYIHISNAITRIKTPEEVVKFLSPLGNSDVPYPYLVTTGKVYLILEGVWFYKSSLVPECRKDPYDQLYDYDGKYKNLPERDQAHTAGFSTKLIMRSTYRESFYARMARHKASNEARKKAAAKKRA